MPLEKVKYPSTKKQSTNGIVGFLSIPKSKQDIRASNNVLTSGNLNTKKLNFVTIKVF